MKRQGLIIGLVGLAIALLPHTGISNVAEPEPPKTAEPERPKNEPLMTPQAVPFKITADRRSKENRLIIPRKFLEKSGARELRGEGLSGMDFRTVIAGLAMSVSVVCFVFLLIRKKSRAAQAIALLMTIGSVGFLCINEARADLAPPISKVPSAWRRVGKDQQNVKIEITDKGDAVELIIGTYYKRSLPPEERHGPQVPPNTGSHPPENATRSE